MSMIHTVALLAVLTTSAAALADPPPRPPAEKKADKPADKPAADQPKKEDDTVSEEDAKRFLAFFDQLVAIVVTNKEDCTKMAAAMNAHIDANRPLLNTIADAKNHNKRLPKHIKDKIAKKSAEELTPAMVAKCNKDRHVMSALMRILPPPPGSAQPPHEDKDRDRDRDGDRDRDRK